MTGSVLYIAGIEDANLAKAFLYLFLLVLWLIVGTGAFASVLSLPTLLATGYGMVPVGWTPAVGGVSPWKAAPVHVLVGTLLFASFLLAMRPAVYLVAVVGGWDGALPGFWRGGTADVAMLVGYVVLVWAAFAVRRFRRTDDTTRQRIVLGSGLAFCVYVLALLPGLWISAMVTGMVEEGGDPLPWTAAIAALVVAQLAVPRVVTRLAPAPSA